MRGGWAAGCAWALCALATAQQPERTRTEREVEVEREGGRQRVEVEQEETRGTTGHTDRTGSLHLMRASKLMGGKVTNPEGQDLGTVDDFAIARDQGRIAYAVLSFGGLLGMGDTHFAIPWHALNFRTDDRVVLHIDKETLKNTPGFKGNDWPQVADRRWLDRARRGERGEFEQAGHEEGDRPAQYAHKGSAIVGRKVRSTNGDDLGTIKDVMVDSRRGRIVYGIISHGGFLGIGDRLVPVPWGAFDITQEDAVRINMDKAKLEAAPNFGDGDWTVLTDREFMNRTHSYYGQRPYMEGGERERDTERERMERRDNRQERKTEVEIERERRGNREEVEIERKEETRDRR